MTMCNSGAKADHGVLSFGSGKFNGPWHDNIRDPGARLKQLRTKLHITTRDVALLSKTIAQDYRNSEFLVSSPWLTQIENNDAAVPSIYKLFTLAVVYGLDYSQVLSMYGVDTTKVRGFHAHLPIQVTHLTQFNSPEAHRGCEPSSSCDAAPDSDNSRLLTSADELKEIVPLQIMRESAEKRRLYGFIGLKDYTLYPLLKPGSFVEIDPQTRRIHQGPVRSEFDRPIYFVDFRTGYACCWCEQIDEKLLLLSHPLSPSRTRAFTYPTDVEIVGQVTAVVSRLVFSRPRQQWYP